MTGLGAAPVVVTEIVGPPLNVLPAVVVELITPATANPGIGEPPIAIDPPLAKPAIDAELTGPSPHTARPPRLAAVPK
jgi:hypothetical protein